VSKNGPNDGKQGNAEMNYNRSNGAGGDRDKKRLAPSDAPGASSSHSRANPSGADQAASSSSGRGGSSPSGTSSSRSDIDIPHGHQAGIPEGSQNPAPDHGPDHGPKKKH